MPLLGCFRRELVEQVLETVAVLGQVDGIGRGAENGNVGALERLGELERRLAAELHNDAMQCAIRPLGSDDFEHVLGGERLEVQPVGRVVVGRDCLGIAVDHDGLVAHLAQGESGVATAIIELDALADAVRTAAEYHDLSLVGWRSLVGRRSGERRLVGRIHVGGRRGELRGAGIDALEYGPYAERVPDGRHFGLAASAQNREPCVREAHRLEAAQCSWDLRQSLFPDFILRLHDIADFGQKPRVDLASGMDVLVAETEPHGLCDLQQAVRSWRTQRRANGIAVIALSEPIDGHFVEPGQPGLERAQRFLQALLECAADRHGFANRFHRGGEHRVGSREFLERETRDLGDHVVDGGLERGWRGAAGYVVGDLVQRVPDRELGRDLGDWKPGRLRGERGRARNPRIHLDDDQATVRRVDRELYVRAAGLDPDLAQHRDRGVAHDLIFLVRERERRRDGDGVPGMHTHRVEVFDRADDDAVVVAIPHDLHLEFLPAEDRFLDQHLVGR